MAKLTKIKSVKEGVDYIASKATIELAEQLCEYTKAIDHLNKRLTLFKNAKTEGLARELALKVQLRRLAALVGEYQVDVLEATVPNKALSDLLKEVDKL